MMFLLIDHGVYQSVDQNTAQASGLCIARNTSGIWCYHQQQQVASTARLSDSFFGTCQPTQLFTIH
jgi:hypothetical protein